MGLGVVKVGGAAVARPGGRVSVAEAVAEAMGRGGGPYVVVHGGGPEIDRWSERADVEVVREDGLRVTTPETLEVVEQVLAGRVNKALVGEFLTADVDAIGVSGVDGDLLRAEIAHGGRLGRVGRITRVRTELIHRLLALGLTPVIASVCRASDGGTLNVNADEAAAAVASALGAAELSFLTDVDRVRGDGGRERSALTMAEARELVAAGSARDGMAVKLGAACSVLADGVAGVRIGPPEILTDPESGTRVTTASAKEAVEQAAAAPSADALLPVYGPAGPVFVGGRGSRLVTEDGTEFLDFTSGLGVTALGHGDAAYRRAVGDALESGLVHTSNLFRTRPAAELAAALAAGSFADRVFFCNSGAEANEAAFKFARRRAREVGGPAKHEIVALRGSFHGRLFGSLAATDRPGAQKPFEPLMPGVRFVSPDDGIEALRAAITSERTAAIIAEPVQGEGGIRPLSGEFLRALRGEADRADAALILDEVQCGLGRCGRLFAYEVFDVVPDIVTLAKPLAGGLPMGAVLLSDRIAKAVRPGDHATTFGGGPLVATAALEVVRRLADPALLAKVQADGAVVRDRLTSLRERVPDRVLDVRGIGLMWGVELSGAAAPVVEHALADRLLVCAAGPNVVRLLPPLTVSRTELADGLERLCGAIERTAEVS